MRIMPAFNIMYNELDNAGIESINAFQYDTGIDPTNTIRHNATLVLYQDAETRHMILWTLGSIPEPENLTTGTK